MIMPDRFGEGMKGLIEAIAAAVNSNAEIGGRKSLAGNACNPAEFCIY